MIIEDQADQQKRCCCFYCCCKASQSYSGSSRREKEREAEESSAELTPGASPTSVQSYRQTDRPTERGQKARCRILPTRTCDLEEKKANTCSRSRSIFFLAGTTGRQAEQDREKENESECHAMRAQSRRSKSNARRLDETSRERTKWCCSDAI